MRAEMQDEVAEGFDQIHSIERARKVGSVDRVICPGGLRRYLVEAVGRGMGCTKLAWGPKGLTAGG